MHISSDYVHRVKTNIAAKNWAIVIAMIAVPTVGGYVGLRTVAYTVDGVVSFIEDLGGPSRSDLKKQLQNQLPSYWEITSIDIKGKQNTGTNVEPRISQRFHAKAKLKEDTFFETSQIDSLPAKKQNNVVFLNASERRGKEVELYGLSTSSLVAEKWQSSFRIDVNPTFNYGQPRNSFSGKTVLRNSREEAEFVSTIQKQLEEEKATLLSALRSGSWLSGTWVEPSGGYNLGDEVRADMQVRFTSFEESSGKLAGEIKFSSSVKRFEGTFRGDEINFKTVSVVQGNDKFGLGTEYKFTLDSSDTMRGTWSHFTQLNIPLASLFPNQGIVERKGPASFKLK